MQIWKKWEPIKNLPSEFYKISLIDDIDGLNLHFEARSKKTRFKVFFDKGVLSYRNTDEGSLLQTIGFFTKKYGKEFLGKTSLFEIEGSSYIEWFLEESSGIYSKNEIKHYVFFTPNDIIEVLSLYPPKVTIEKLP